MQERKFRAPPSLPSARASTMESLIFPTSGPYATLGAFHPSSTTKAISTKASKGSSLPAPPFVFPSHGLRQQIREANDPTLSAAPVGTAPSKEKLLKNDIPEEESDSDEVTFVSSSLVKGKGPSRAKHSPPAAVRATPLKSESQKRKRPVDMDFFSIPSASASTRQNHRRSSILKGSSNDTSDRSFGPPSIAGTASSHTHPSPRSPAAAAIQTATVTPATSARSPAEGSRARLNTTLFVPKRRKVH